MKFSYSWLKTLVNFKHSPEKLAEFLSKRVFEVESVQKIGDDFALEIKLPPNRVPDAAGHVGMAREIAALQYLKLKIKNEKLKELRIKENNKKRTKDFLAIVVKDREKCRRYVGRVIRDITIKDSPQWLRERLTVCGLQSINNVVDATNYIMLETGQPLHVFDYEKITDKKIIVRNAEVKEKIVLLDGRNIELSPDDLVIADAKQPLALAGIKGGVSAEIDVNTKHIVLESANFESAGIRGTSIRLGIKTDSSYRFEHDLRPELAGYGLERLAALIQEIAGGECLRGIIDIYPQKEKYSSLIFRTERANSVTGLSLSSEMYKDLLLRTGCKISGTKKLFKVAPPIFRRDLTCEADLIEEAARIYGYENIPEIIPPIFKVAAENDELKWIRFIRQSLVRLGFSEIYQYALIGERDIKKNTLKIEDYIELENPLSPDLKFLTREPYENFFRYISRNDIREELSVFSIDVGFSRAQGSGDDTMIAEEKYLTVARALDLQKTDDKGRKAFYVFKGVVSELLDGCGINDYWFDDEFSDKANYARLQILKHLHPHRRAELKIGEDTIAIIGEANPSILENWKIERRVFIAEFLVKKLTAYAQSEIEFKEVPKFPAAQRDMAIVVGTLDRIDAVQGVIENAGGEILEDADFFDEYAGAGVAGDARSLAFRLTFRDKKRTLTDAEINTAIKNITVALQAKGWEIR